MMKNLTKNFLLVFLILLLSSALFTVFSDSLKTVKRVPLNQLVSDVNAEQVKQIVVSGNALFVAYKDDTKAQSRKETGVSLADTLMSYGADKEKLGKIEIELREEGGFASWIGPLSFIILPLLSFVFFFWLMMRQAKAGMSQAFDFTKAKARLFGAEGQAKERVSFKDVAGLKEAKEEVQEVVDFLKNPVKYQKMGARIPRGVLLVGAPGTGKTLLARAVASEAGVPFFSASGSEFIEMFVGVGSSITGDTSVLIRTAHRTQLLPIQEFVDSCYKEHEEGYVVPVSGIQTLGYKKAETKFYGAKNGAYSYFGNSAWSAVQGVYRHKVNEIYEITYLGGTLRTTGDHSIFVRHRNLITAKRADELRQGDILVNLPFKVRSAFIPGIGTTHKVKSHEMERKENLYLPVWNSENEQEQWETKYAFALANQHIMLQKEIGSAIGVSQSTVGLWQRGINRPRFFSFSNHNREKHIPQEVPVSTGLLKLLGYYTAEGRAADYYLQFVFGAHEKEYHQECISLMRSLFGLNPHLRYTKENALRITYHSKVVRMFFERHCGNGSKRKHVPEFLWETPKELFLAYLEGYTNGDGYTDKEGRLAASSVSKQLIRELAWICAMHGIQVGIGKGENKAGRIIKHNGKPTPGGAYWSIKFGKTSHPFQEVSKHPFQFKKPVVQKIEKKEYDGYVYDLCGCENEAFFGGEKPLLLHNSRVRDLFSTAKKAGRSIVFIDELDAIGRTRGIGFGGGHDEREQTLNQILVEMDGFEKDSATIIVAATNRPDVLDPALLRPGRFDRTIILDLPDVNDREEIMNIHAHGKPFASDVKLREIAERTPGFSGADLANLVNEAAILAARRNKTQVYQTELLEAIEKVLLGPERKSHVLSKKEKEITAFHEAGHALVASSLPNTDPVRKVSIISRGRAGGYTLKLPVEDKHLKSRKEFIDELAVLLGGYEAEKLVFQDITTGASNDLKKASEIARSLVKEYGMSATFGPVTFGEKEELMFLRKETAEYKNYSDQVAAQIDKEVNLLLLNAGKTAKTILSKKRKTLEKIARVLIEKETIEREEFERLVGKIR